MEPDDHILEGAETIRREAGPEEAPTAALPRAKLIGVTLEGRYLIKRRLGQGGFGAVYLAVDQKMVSRKVVVKVLHDETAKNAWIVNKFKQEIEALTRINHPGVVGVFDTGRTPEGQPFIVMQYVDGVTLRSQITAEGMPFWRAAKIFTQLGRALSAAHQAGILHRDLKPENVMLETLTDDDEHVKIIDFGIAKIKNSIVSRSTVEAQSVGTLYYMSPEQLCAQPLTPASDVYSLGVIAYEMLTGRRPINPDSVFQILELQRSGVRVKPADLRPSLPRGAEPAILKALSFEPPDRYQSARDFADVLAGALMGDDDPAKRQTLLREVERPEAPEIPEASALETAHVLFMDIVGYSKSLIDQQRGRLHQLQQIVLATEECKRANKDNLIRLPTGDGLALVFFGDPESPVRCAIEVSRALRQQPEIELRMGVHSGLVYRIADVNTNMNVAGGGINIAQRVMDCGDCGHIILSNRVADDLGQLARWSNFLHDLGNVEVKHGLQVHVFNLYGDDFGNAEPPAKCHVTSAPASYKRPLVAAILLLTLGLVAAGLWYALRPRTPAIAEAKPVTVAPVGPERSLTYWLKVQMNDGGKAIESTGQEIYGNGSHFQFNIEPAQEGALYLLNEGPGKNSVTEYNVLFPTPGNNKGVAQLVAKQRVQTGWNRFVAHTGVEKLWLIWSARPVPDLDQIFREAASHDGVIVDEGQLAKLTTYLKKYESAPPNVKSDKASNRTLITGQGDIMVQLVELSHRDYK